MFNMQFSTKHLFKIFDIWKADRMKLFCNLFIKRPS